MESSRPERSGSSQEEMRSVRDALRDTKMCLPISNRVTT
jgi:hypothetical protein